ncbi:MAG: hypothetical protein QM652_11260 [Legionella sp.]|uniref:protein kinase domain-containing protein n=1 Tax=Legionella sp. TaxID=459 RepID=UPI0039E5B4ED
MTAIYFFNYVDTARIFRKITVIDGVPFYCSSGTNSGCPETWFPFLGLDWNGWFRKPGFIKELSNLYDTIPPQYNNFFPTTDIRKRFASLKCLLISSVIGGGFWKTENGETLLSQLKQDHPDFYKNNVYELQDSHITYNTENKPALSIDVKRIYRKINELLEEGTKNSLTTEFYAALFYQNFVECRFAKETLCPIKSNTITLFKPKYPEFPKTLSPTYHKKMIWPSDIERSFSLTEEQREETENYIKARYPYIIEDMRTKTPSCYYSVDADEDLQNTYQGMKTYLNIKFLHNGEIVVYRYKDVRYNNRDTLSLNVYNLSRGEWNVLKNTTPNFLIPYLKLLSDEPHIAKIYDFTEFDHRISQIGKLYHKNLTELMLATPLSTEQKNKFMLSLLQGLNTIHKIPYRFERTEGYLSHADIKFENIFYDENVDNVVIDDLDESGKWNVLTASSCFIAPEFALEMLKLQTNHYTDDHIITFNKDKGQGIDVWNLGLVFAGLLQGKLVNHDTYLRNVYFPNLNFVLDRLQPPEYRLTFMSDIASLDQTEVDEELNRIKQKLPQTSEGQKLCHLWNIVHQMLQVSPKKRPTCMELLSQMQLQRTELSAQETAGLHRNSIFSINRTNVTEHVKSNSNPSPQLTRVWDKGLWSFKPEIVLAKNSTIALFAPLHKKSHLVKDHDRSVISKYSSSN